MFDDFESRRSGKDGIARLELADFKLNLICFRFADIGGVGNNKVEEIGFDP